MPHAPRLPPFVVIAAAVILPALSALVPGDEPVPEPPPWTADGNDGAGDVSGSLDLLSSDPALGRLERLVAEDRHTEAFEEAVDVLASRAGRDGPFQEETLQSLQWVALAAAAGGDRETAESLLDALLTRRRATLRRGDLRLAETLIRRGRVARVYDDPALARRCLAEARRIAEHGVAPARLRAALAQTEGTLELRSDLGAALAGYRQALEIRRRHGHAGLALADNMAWMAWVLDRLGRTDEARAAGLEAQALLGALRLTDTALDATLQYLVADDMAVADRWDEAVPLYASAARVNEATRTRHLGGFARRICPPDGYEALALAAVLRGDGEAGWEFMQHGRAAMHRDLLALGGGRDRRDPGFRALRALRRELGDRMRERATAGGGGESAWSAATWRTTLRILTLRARLARMERSLLEARPAKVPSLRRLQRLLDPATAVVGWLEVDAGGPPSQVSQPRRSWGYGYVVRSTGPVHWIPLWDGRRPLVEESPRFGWGPVFARIRRAASWPLRVDPDPEVDRQLREWTLRFFDPLLPFLGGVERLVVEGTRMPVEVFKDDAGRSLLDRFTITYTPSAAFLTLLDREPGGPPVPRSALALSASTATLGGSDLLTLARADDRRDLRFTRNAFRRDQVALDRLPSLRFAGLEAWTVAGRFPAAMVLQGDGAEAGLRVLSGRGRLRDFDVVHIATHTLFDAAPERSGLVLAERPVSTPEGDDGVLEAEEIALGWDLDGALVTLSACESGRTAGIWRGEDLGIAPALFAAGADTVLVSLWPVDDRATAILMDRFYAGISGADGATLSPAAALRDAKIRLREFSDRNHRPFEHPAYWGGFVLIGRPGPRD